MPLPVSYQRASRSIKQFIKDHEALRLMAYRDPGGVLTIGYGHTSDSFMPVTEGMIITESQAEAAFEHDIKEAEDWVKSRLQRRITGKQFDALVSHTFNTGGSVGLINLINQGAHADDIYHWFTSRYTSQNGQLLAGLIRRRKEEADIYFA